MNANARGPIVQCRGLTKTYGVRATLVYALHDVDLDIDAGDFVSLSGPSGSGKTTLLNHLGGLDQPTSGTVTVAGQSLGALDKNSLADLRLNKIGFVFQAYNLIPVLNAYENVEFILQLQGVRARERRQRSRQMLIDVGLEGLGERRPGELSGGQQQRVAIARAVASRPTIVLADEPSANLDSVATDGLLQLMRRLNEQSGTTFCVASHDPRVIAYARRRIGIRDGRIEADERA
ncbi:MAG TPA: ABC transporter ATP-binding protein [Acidiferrobacter sp.]|nr:ABC transporter ATP-binding protein [Acidiferrobacter sp.]